MAKKDNKRNYDNRPLNDDEILVPFPYDETCAKENFTNPSCIKHLTKEWVTVKVMYQAVPATYAKTAKSLINLEMNEKLGHYCKKDALYIDGLQEEYEHDVCTVPSAEDAVMEKEDIKEKGIEFRRRMNDIISHDPKTAFAMLLIMNNPKLKGPAFEAKMHLGRDASATVRNRALEYINVVMREHKDVEVTKRNRSKHDFYYHSEALKLLDIVADALYAD